MAGFFAIETLGTLLAPTLIDDVPLFIVAISPGDHHIALARSTNWMVLFTVALTARIGKYYITYRFAGDGLDEMRRVGLHRAARLVDSRLARRSWALGVIFLPGMWAAMLCASQKIPHGRYVFVMVTSTAGFVGLSVAASEALDQQLTRVTDALTAHSVPATIGIAVVLVAFLTYRFLRLGTGAPADEPTVASNYDPAP